MMRYDTRINSAATPRREKVKPKFQIISRWRWLWWWLWWYTKFCAPFYNQTNVRRSIREKGYQCHNSQLDNNR